MDLALAGESQGLLGMSRQAVIETGSFTVKAGLWEQTFIPTTRISSTGRFNDENGKIIWGGKIFPDPTSRIVRPVVDGRVVDFQLLEELWYAFTIKLYMIKPIGDMSLAASWV